MPRPTERRRKHMQAAADYAKTPRKWSRTDDELRNRMRGVLYHRGAHSPMAPVFSGGPVTPMYRFEAGGLYGIPLRIVALRNHGTVQNSTARMKRFEASRRYPAREDAFAHVRQYLTDVRFSLESMRDPRLDHVYDAIVSFLLEWTDDSLEAFARYAPEFAPLAEMIRQQWRDGNEQYIGSVTARVDRRKAWLETAQGAEALARARQDDTYDVWSAYRAANYDCGDPVMEPFSEDAAIVRQYDELGPTPTTTTTTTPMTPAQAAVDTDDANSEEVGGSDGSDNDNDDDAADDDDNADDDDPAEFQTITIAVVRVSVKLLASLFKERDPTAAAAEDREVVQWSQYWTESFCLEARAIARAVCSQTGLDEATRLIKSIRPGQLPIVGGKMPLVDSTWRRAQLGRTYSTAEPPFHPRGGFRLPETAAAAAATTGEADDGKTPVSPAETDTDSKEQQQQQQQQQSNRICKFITGQTSCGKTTMLRVIQRYGYRVFSRGDIGSFGGKATNAATIATLHAAQQLVLGHRNVVGDRSIIDNALWACIMTEADPKRYAPGSNPDGRADGDALFEQVRSFFDSCFNEAAVAGFVDQKGLVLLDPHTERNRARQMKRSTGGDLYRARLTNYFAVQFVVYYMAARLFSWPILLVPYDEAGNFGSTQENLNFALNYFGPPEGCGDDDDGDDDDGGPTQQRYAKPTDEYACDHSFAKAVGIYK